MVLMEPHELTDDRVKAIAIGEYVCVIAIVKLASSKDFYKVDRRSLTLTRSYIESLPPARQSVSYVTPELLQAMPVLMFESCVEDGKFFRFDGRHRILGAWELGLTSVPALWFPREVWSKYIAGRKSGELKQFGGLKTEQTDIFPWLWERSPFLPADGRADRHLEPNFDLPKEWFTY